MSIFSRLFESKEAKEKRMEAEEKRMEAERLAEEARIKRATEELKARRLEARRVKAERRAPQMEKRLSEEKSKRLAQALAQAQEREALHSSISMLGRNDLPGPPPYGHLLDLGKRAIPRILPLLDLPLTTERNDLTDCPPEFQNNVTIVAAAAELLGKLGAAEAIPKLRALSKTKWFQVQRNARASLIALEAEWTDELKLDFLRTFLPNADAGFSDSSRSGFHEKYSKWCQRHGIKSSNKHGGYSFYGKLDDLIWDDSHPDDAWCEFKLTEKGLALLKGG